MNTLLPFIPIFLLFFIAFIQSRRIDMLEDAVARLDREKACGK